MEDAASFLKTVIITILTSTGVLLGLLAIFKKKTEDATTVALKKGDLATAITAQMTEYTQQMRDRIESLEATLSRNGEQRQADYQMFSAKIRALESENRRCRQENASLKTRLTSVEQEKLRLNRANEALANEMRELRRSIGGQHGR